MNEPFDLISVGINTVDVLVRLPERVLHEDKQYVQDLIIQGGSPTGSAAAAVARFGYRAATVMRLGHNVVSAISLEELRSSRICEDLVVRDDTSRPAIALVEIDPATGGRTVFIQMDNYGYLRPEDIPADDIRAGRVLLVDSYDLDATEVALRAARGTKCRTVLDFESGDADRLRALLALGSDAILPLACGSALTGREAPEEVVRALADLTEGQTIVTDGRAGSWAWVRAGGTVLHQGSFPVSAIDTTGCGDAYHAGYVIGLLEGWPLPLRMEFAALLASRVATRVGGRSALPFREDAASLIRPEVSRELRAVLEKPAPAERAARRPAAGKHGRPER